MHRQINGYIIYCMYVFNVYNLENQYQTIKNIRLRTKQMLEMQCRVLC